MEAAEQHVVVTGGGGGIGSALAAAFAEAGARHVVVMDLDAMAASSVADELVSRGFSASSIAADVSDEQRVSSAIADAVTANGDIDVLVSNAGVAHFGGLDASNDEWDRQWRVHVMGHVFAARAVVPSMVARSHGHLVLTASAAGILSRVGAAPYTVSKHATVALAEWLSITYGDAGIGVSCLCPLAVRTPMLDIGRANGGAGAQLTQDDRGVAEPADVAKLVLDAVRDGTFMVYSHPEELSAYVERKHGDHERWLRGMRRLNAKL